MVSINPRCPNHDDKETDRGLITQNVSKDISLKDGHYRFRTSYSGQHATEVSSHTNGLVSLLHLYCSTQHFHFQIPELHFFFRKGLIHAAVSRGRKMKQHYRKRKTDHIKEGPFPKASKLIFLFLTGVKVPASTSRDAWLLCPKLLENKLLTNRLVQPLCNPPQQTDPCPLLSAPRCGSL